MTEKRNSRLTSSRDGLIKPGLRKSIGFAIVIMAFTAAFLWSVLFGLLALLGAMIGFSAPWWIPMIPAALASGSYLWVRDLDD